MAFSLIVSPNGTPPFTQYKLAGDTITQGSDTVSVPYGAICFGALGGGSYVAVSASNPLPVTVISAPTTTVTGTVAVSSAPTTAVTGPLTDAQLRASAVPVSLASTTITGTVGVTGTFWQTTQPVSIASVPTHGVTLTEYTPVSGRLPVDGSAVTQPVKTGGSTLATVQVSAGTSATQLVASRTGRKLVIVTQHGTTAVFLGTASVTTSNGLRLAGTDGTTQVIPTDAAVYGIVSTGSQTVSVMEVY